MPCDRIGVAVSLFGLSSCRRRFSSKAHWLLGSDGMRILVSISKTKGSLASLRHLFQAKRLKSVVSYGVASYAAIFFQNVKDNMFHLLAKLFFTTRRFSRVKVVRQLQWRRSPKPLTRWEHTVMTPIYTIGEAKVNESRMRRNSQALAWPQPPGIASSSQLDFDKVDARISCLGIDARQTHQASISS